MSDLDDRLPPFDRHIAQGRYARAKGRCSLFSLRQRMALAEQAPPDPPKEEEPHEQ